MAHFKSFRSITDYLNRIPKNVCKYFVLCLYAIILTINNTCVIITNIQRHFIYLLGYTLYFSQQEAVAVPVISNFYSLSKLRINYTT